MRVKIKTWGELEAEFGLTAARSINCEHTMPREMDRQIPWSRVVTVAPSTYSESDIMVWDEWKISDDMIEEYL